MNKPMRPADIAVAVLIAVIWGLTFVAMKVGLNVLPPLLFSGLRFLLASLPLVFLVGRPDVGWRWILAIGLTLGACMVAFQFLGIHTGLPAGLTSLVLQSQVAFTAVFALAFFRDVPTPRRLGGLVVCFAGLVLIGRQYAADNAMLLGFALVLMAGAAWAAGNILIKRSGSSRQLQLIVWMSLVPPLPLFLLSWMFEGEQRIGQALGAMGMTEAVALIYLVMATLVGFGLWARLIARHGPAAVAPFSLLVPIFGFGSSALMLGESVSVATAMASVVIVLGLYFMVVPRPERLVGAPVPKLSQAH